MLPLLLVITANRTTAEPIRAEISASGIKAYYVETLTAALGVVGQWRFDAILLLARGFERDVPNMLRSLRRGAEVPLVLVIDRADEEEQLEALELGAIQVLAETASPRVVIAQLRSLMDVFHPQPRQQSSEVRFGPLRLDPRRAIASIGNSLIALTGSEFELLLLLASRPGELVHRKTIARTLGNASGVDARRSADMHVCRIRRKLKDAGGQSLQVETVYGRGYLLRLGPASADADADEVQEVEWTA